MNQSNINSGFQLIDDLTKDITTWERVLEKMLAVPSYKKFFEVTSPYKPVVVRNNSSITPFNQNLNCHFNVKNAVENGLGEHVFGWEICNEFVFKQMPRGLCQLVSHSNLLDINGELFNITQKEFPFSFFLRDDSRKYDFTNRIGYNNRLIYGDDFKPNGPSRNIPRNKLFYESQGEIDRNMFFEKFQEPEENSLESIQKLIPKNLSAQEKLKWISLKIAPLSTSY